MIGVLALIQHRIALIDRTFYSILLILLGKCKYNYRLWRYFTSYFGAILLPTLALFFFYVTV